MYYDDQGPYLVEELLKDKPENPPNNTKSRKFHKIMRIFFVPANPFPICRGLTKCHNGGKLCANR